MPNDPALCACPRPRRVSLAAGVVALIAVAAVDAGALYRWTDADGTVHFSDSLPLEKPAGGFEGEQPPTVGDALREEAEQARLRRIEERRRAELEAERQARIAAAQSEVDRLMNQKTIVSQYGCEEAKQILAAQREPRRTYYSVGADGSFQRRSAEEAAAMVAEWEKAVAELCADNVKVVAPGTPEAEKALAEAAAAEAEAGTGTATEGAATQ